MLPLRILFIASWATPVLFASGRIQEQYYIYKEVFTEIVRQQGLARNIHLIPTHFGRSTDISYVHKAGLKGYTDKQVTFYVLSLYFTSSLHEAQCALISKYKGIALNPDAYLVTHFPFMESHISRDNSAYVF